MIYFGFVILVYSSLIVNQFSEKKGYSSSSYYYIKTRGFAELFILLPLSVIYIYQIYLNAIGKLWIVSFSLALVIILVLIINWVIGFTPNKKNNYSIFLSYIMSLLSFLLLISFVLNLTIK